METGNSKNGVQEDLLAQEQKSSGLMRVIRAVWYSLEGIGAGLKHESAFRQESIAACVLVPLALWLPFGGALSCLLIFSCFAVLIVELLNSALEWTVDYISLDKHPMAKRAKDMGSGAVFLSIINVCVIWAYALYSHWSVICDCFH